MRATDCARPMPLRCYKNLVCPVDTQVNFLIARFIVTSKQAKAMHFSSYSVAALSAATLCLVGSPVAGETFARLEVALEGETAQDHRELKE